MITIEEQIDARKKLTRVMDKYMCSSKEDREQNRINFEEGVRIYEARFGQAFHPYYIPREDK